MSESVPSTLLSALPAASSVSDTDIVVLENGSTTQKITIAQLKEALGITALNTKILFDASSFHFYPIWIVQHFECFKLNGIVVINASLFCNGNIQANVNYAMTSETIDTALIPADSIRIIGNACDGNFGNTVNVNLFFDNNLIKINMPGDTCRYIAFSAVYRTKN